MSTFAKFPGMIGDWMDEVTEHVDRGDEIRTAVAAAATRYVAGIKAAVADMEACLGAEKERFDKKVRMIEGLKKEWDQRTEVLGIAIRIFCGWLGELSGTCRRIGLARSPRRIPYIVEEVGDRMGSRRIPSLGQRNATRGSSSG